MTDEDAGQDLPDATPPGADASPPLGDAGTGEPNLNPIVSNEEFYVTSKGGTPTVDVDTWRLEINGAVNNAASLTFADLEALGAVPKEHTLVCIGASPSFPAIGNAQWSGRPLADVLASAGVAPTAAALELQFEGADGYETSIPITDLDDRELWLVWEMNGQPLPPNHGYPVRMLTPGRYGIKNPKWLTRITLGTEPLLGYWESVGWSNDGTYRPVCFFHTPPKNSEVAPGVVALQGSAFCGQVDVTRVEVSVDGGTVWQPAAITYSGPQDTWTLWRFDWQPPSTGNYELLARIECADGQTTDRYYQNDLGGYTGYGTLSVTVG